MMAFAKNPYKIVLVGDHMQLGPIVQSDINRSEEKKLDISLFERLISMNHPEISSNMLDT